LLASRRGHYYSPHCIPCTEERTRNDRKHLLQVVEVPADWSWPFLYPKRRRTVANMSERARTVETSDIPVDDGPRCLECHGDAVAGTPYCERHLRGATLAALDRRRWPRLKLNASTIAGDEQWRPWLREATASQLAHVLKLLGAEAPRHDH
jgi:hypothetical protein